MSATMRPYSLSLNGIPGRVLAASQTPSRPAPVITCHGGRQGATIMCPGPLGLLYMNEVNILASTFFLLLCANCFVCKRESKETISSWVTFNFTGRFIFCLTHFGLVARNGVKGLGQDWFRMNDLMPDGPKPLHE